MDMTGMLATPGVQYGFAGFAFLLLVILAWVVKRLLNVLERATTVIAGNTAAIQTLASLTNENKRMLASLKSELSHRPCLRSRAHKSVGGGT